MKALAKLVRGKLQAAFQKRRPDLSVPEAAWSKPWVTQCTPWGEGERGVLDYLARYVFRVAITNTRIVGLTDQTVTIRHKQRKSNRWLTSCIPGHEFMRRFLQHVRPKGLHKVRYSGLWHPARREQAARVRQLLLLDHHPPASERTEENNDANKLTADRPRPGESWMCPRCETGHLVHVRRLAPKWAQGP